MARQEDREVVALGNFDDDVFVDALVVEVFSELLSKQPGVCPDDAVLAGVIAGRTLEDVNPDVLLGSFLCTIP
jgi:hypothetical protein